MKKIFKPKYPRKKAVALKYDRKKDSAPRLIGKGEGLLADRLLALAREYNIPVREDADLLEILAQLNLYEEIPPATYFVVAEILAFIYQTNDSYQPE